MHYLVLESTCDEDVKGSRLLCDPIPRRLGVILRWWPIPRVRCSFVVCDPCEHNREHRTVWLLLRSVPPQLQRKFPGSSEINTALRPLIKLTPYVASRHGTDPRRLHLAHRFENHAALAEFTFKIPLQEVGVQRYVRVNLLLVG